MDTYRTTALQYLEYNAWATARTLQSVEPMSPEEMHRDMRTSHSSVWGTLTHAYQADAVWLKRLKGQADAKLNDAAPPADLAALRTAWSGVQSQFISYAGGLSDADWPRIIDYRFMSGATGRSPIYQSILHVVNHATYHRGQIVTMLRQLGAEPIATDFIHFVRTVMTEQASGAS